MPAFSMIGESEAATSTHCPMAASCVTHRSQCRIQRRIPPPQDKISRYDALGPVVRQQFDDRVAAIHHRISVVDRVRRQQDRLRGARAPKMDAIRSPSARAYRRRNPEIPGDSETRRPAEAVRPARGRSCPPFRACAGRHRSRPTAVRADSRRAAWPCAMLRCSGPVRALPSAMRRAFPGTRPGPAFRETKCDHHGGRASLRWCTKRLPRRASRSPAARRDRATGRMAT